MRIWFDISNSPHVNMFYHLIEDLTESGHEVIITSRPLANTIDLLNQKELIHHTIGVHYGKSIFRKIWGYPIRVIQLYFFLRKKNIHISVSQSSFHSPLVAFLLGIPSIYTNDNEHAIANFPCFILATKILVPNSFKFNFLFNMNIFNYKIIRYPGIKEGIYLWVKQMYISNIRSNQFNQKPTIYFRPEPQTAQYYTGKTFFLDELIVSLQSRFRVIILTRDASQYNHYKQSIFKYSNVPAKPIEFDDIAANCNLFIGAGGSMTRELAILGIPTISVYQDSLLEVDRLLISHNLLIHAPFLSLNIIDDVLDNSKDQLHFNSLLKDGKLAYDMLKNVIIAFQ